MKKKLLALVLSFMMAAALIPGTYVRAISFVNLFGSLTGDVVNIIPAAGGGLFVEAEGEKGVFRLYVSNDTYVLGGSLNLGDTVTGYFGMVALDYFKGEVLGMTPAAPGQYEVQLTYTGTWLGGGSRTFRVDFNRTFLHGAFEVGDIITVHYNPWGGPDIFDMPQYTARFIVNGDYDVCVGALVGNRVRNRARGLEGYDGVELDIGDETVILTGSGEPFTGELQDHSHLALVFNNSVIEKVVVIWQPVSIENMITPTNDPIPEHPGRGFDHPSIFAEMPSAWAVEYVAGAVRRGLVSEDLQSNFTQTITRIEFASLAVNLYEAVRGEITGRAASFTDADNEIAEKAAFIGIVSGVGDNRFEPNGVLTREQAAVILSLLAETLEQPLSGNRPAFADHSEISAWAVTSVESVVAVGVMSGVGDDFFAPQQLLTREQGIVAVMRLLGLMNGTFSEPAVRVAIYIPDVPTAQALELIYAGEHNRYYLSSISSGIIMLTFEDGTTVSLRDALNQEKITVTDLVLNGLRVISVPQHDR